MVGIALHLEKEKTEVGGVEWLAQSPTATMDSLKSDLSSYPAFPHHTCLDG